MAKSGKHWHKEAANKYMLHFLDFDPYTSFTSTS